MVSFFLFCVYFSLLLYLNKTSTTVFFSLLLLLQYCVEQRYNFQQNNNNNNNNYNHKLQRTKSKMDLPQQQQQTTLNNVYIGATSTLWNTQQQDRYSGVREHYSHQGKFNFFFTLSSK